MASDRPNPRVQVATVSADGVPSLRTVVLRGLLGDGTPYFFTDGRSRKVDHLDSHSPHLSMLAWFESTRQQFRLSGLATVHGAHAVAPWDTLRVALWERLPPDERTPFFGAAPGRILVDAAPVATPGVLPPNFVVVSLAVAEVDWLVLGPPHQRASFRKVGATWLSQRLTP